MKYYLLSILLLAIILILSIITLLFVTDTTSEPFESHLSIINLVLYSEDKEYNEMHEITKKYYSKFKNVTTIYYKYNQHIREEYKMIDDVLNIKGRESYVPGILEKTIKAFQYINDNYNFDYVIRSNISTIVNFDLLCKYLQENPIEYGGGLKMILQQIDKPAGIVDSTYFGTEYASGTCIIFSKHTFIKFLKVKDKIKYDLIDDVAIGVCIDEELGYVKKKYIPDTYFLFIPDVKGDAGKILEIIGDKRFIFYRNRQPDRKTDISQMKLIVNYLN